MADLYECMSVNLFSLLTRVVNYDYLNLEGSDLFSEFPLLKSLQVTVEDLKILREWVPTESNKDVEASIRLLIKLMQYKPRIYFDHAVSVRDQATVWASCGTKNRGDRVAITIAYLSRTKGVVGVQHFLYERTATENIDILENTELTRVHFPDQEKLAELLENPFKSGERTGEVEVTPPACSNKVSADYFSHLLGGM